MGGFRGVLVTPPPGKPQKGAPESSRRPVSLEWLGGLNFLFFGGGFLGLAKRWVCGSVSGNVWEDGRPACECHVVCCSTVKIQHLQIKLVRQATKTKFNEIVAFALVAIWMTTGSGLVLWHIPCERRQESIRILKQKANAREGEEKKKFD